MRSLYENLIEATTKVFDILDGDSNPEYINQMITNLLSGLEEQGNKND